MLAFKSMDCHFAYENILYLVVSSTSARDDSFIGIGEDTSSFACRIFHFKFLNASSVAYICWFF